MNTADIDRTAEKKGALKARPLCGHRLVVVAVEDAFSESPNLFIKISSG